MSKHLRFVKLLGMLAILLTLSFAWNSVSAQNVSSEKVLYGFKFMDADNANLWVDAVGTINQTTRVVALTLPYEYSPGEPRDIAGKNLTVKFASSDKSNFFKGVDPTGLALGEGLGSASWITGVATTYVDGEVLTVEAENHSYENYTLDITWAAPLTAKDLLSFSGAWTKPWAGPCPANGTFSGNAAGTFSGTNVTYNVPFNTNLAAVTVDLTISDWATVVPADGAVVNFSGGPVAFTVTAQDGSTKVYNVSAVVGPASPLDQLLAFAVPGSTSVAIDHTTQTIAVTIPWSTASVSPTWSVSAYAHVFATNPLLGPAVELCSGAFAVPTVGAGPFTTSIWIQAEDPSEVSEYVITLTKSPASSAKDLTAISGSWSKVLACAAPVSGTVVGSISGTTVTFNVPYGVASVTLTSASVSALAGYVVSAAPMVTGTTITVTAEDGTNKVYTVAVVAGAAANGKQLLTYGFKMVDNNPFPFPDWTVDYAGTIDQVNKLVNVTVAWNTDLHDLKAYFTSSPYSCVYIAESNGSYTTQVSQTTINDHSNSLTYVVVAEDGTEERYDVVVNKAAALDGKDLLGFKLTGFPNCFGASTYDVNGVYDGTNIAVSVKYGTNLTNLAYAFTLSTGATASISSPGTANFTNPVAVTVTAQNGTTKVYTITVTPRAQNSEKKLLTYRFNAALNGAFGIANDAVGTVNEAAKTVHVWVPWETRGNNLKNLVASFTLSNGAVMTRSEDTQFAQVSGSSANDFTTPVAYTVWAEDCSTVEYFVTVFVTPDVNTGISAFDFSVVGCECWSSAEVIDPYARRIHITLPNTMNISSLAPSFIGLAPGATISPAATVAQNWTTGPKKYTVTAPDGVTKADWMVWVENPKCTKTDIVSFTMPLAQVAPGDLVWADPVVIDKDNHTIHVIVKSGLDMSRLYYERTLDCGATICCVDGACQDNHYLDFSEESCHTCVVTAEDQSVTQEWTICVEVIDVTPPEVTTWSVMAYNCSDSVAVQSNEMGRVFIVHESAISNELPLYDLTNYTGGATAGGVANLVADRLGNWATVDSAGYPKYVSTHGLYSGVYWAFSVDEWGNVSCISKQKLYLDICDVDVANLCELRSQPPVWRFRVTGEMVVTYEETRGTGNWTFAQDADCGIMMEDRLGAWTSAWGKGAGLTNVMGMLDKSDIMVKLIPVCCYMPTKSSTGNVVTPIEVGYEDYYANVWQKQAYQSMLVKITNPMATIGVYPPWPPAVPTNWVYNYDYTVEMVDGSYDAVGDWFLSTKFANVNYFGDAIPALAYYQGIRYDIGTIGGYTEGYIVPTAKTDFKAVAGPMIYATPNPAGVDGVLPTTCAPIFVDIYNEGIGNLPITAIYLDDAPGTDEFHIVNPPVVPLNIASWNHITVQVNFCPLNVGDEATTLLIEYGVGQVLSVPINGTTAVINDMDWCDNFNSWTQGEWIGFGWTGSVPGNLSVYPTNTQGWGGTPGGSIAMHLRNRLVVGGVRVPIQITTPGVRVTGSDPVITWVERKYTAFNGTGTDNSPRNLYVSTDGVNYVLVDSYSTATMPDAAQGFRTKTYSLAAYVGQTIWWRFELISNNNEYIYWVIDNVCVQERITTPIISGASYDFGGVQVGESATHTFEVANTGVSVLKVKSVALVGDGFTMADANTYPVEVEGMGVAYSINGDNVLSVDVTFAPGDVGAFAGKLVVVWGLYEDHVFEIPFTGEGLSCYTAEEAFIGDNNFFQNSWFKYTAEKFQITTITSCHPHNDAGYNAVYAYDTYLYVYSDCEGTLIGSNDDMESACAYNRASSTLQVVMNEGESVYIFWPLAFPTSEHAYDEMVFTITPSYPIDGDVCETAIPLTLPVVNHFGSTAMFNDDYDASPCSPFSNYMDGNDKVYQITLEKDGYLNGSILGAYGSIHVLDKCPKTELLKENCKAFVGGPNGGEFTRKRIQAGTYYVIISSWAPPQTVDYLLNMSVEEASGVEDNNLLSNVSVFPNPTNGEFTVNISNAEASDLTIELVNISGQVVYRNNVKGVYSYTESIDATEFAKGVYYLKVNNGEGVQIEKVVVQ